MSEIIEKGGVYTLSELADRVVELNDALASSKEANKCLLDEVNRLTIALAEAQEIRAQSEKQYETLSKRAHAIAAERDRLEIDCSEAKAELAKQIQACAENTELRKKLQRSEENNAALRAGYDIAVCELRENQRYVTTLLMALELAQKVSKQ